MIRPENLPVGTAPMEQSTTPSASPEELHLLARLSRRETDAVAEAYALYGGVVFSYALRALGSREDAEEVLQDTFVRLWEKADHYDPAQGRPFTWVFMVARGLCLDRQRSAGRRTRRLQKATREDPAADTGLSPRSWPRIFPQDELRQVLISLQQLPTLDRRAVEMAVFLECTGAEIADQTCEPLGTVKTRLRRGLARLRQLLKHHDD